MRKLSPFKAVSHALNSVWSYRSVALRIGMVWVPIMLVAGLVELYAARRTRSSQEMTPQALVQVVTGIISIIAVCSMAVSWHRFILRDEPAAGLRLDGDVFRYAGNTVLIMLAMLVPALVFLTVMVFAPAAGAVLGLPLIVLAGGVVTRASIKLPAVALGNTSFSFRDAWTASEGNFWPCVGVFLLNAAILLGILLVLTVVASAPRAAQRRPVARVPADRRCGAAAVLCDLQRLDLHLPLRLLRRAARFLTARFDRGQGRPPAGRRTLSASRCHPGVFHARRRNHNASRKQRRHQRTPPQRATPAEPSTQPERLSPARARHNPEAIRHAFETGEFPYKTRLGTKLYEQQMAELQVELLKAAELGEGDGRAHHRPVRGPRRRRQGRHHQALHGAPEPARRPRRGARKAQRARAHASGTSSATSSICRPAAKSCSSTAPGTTAPASSG